MQTRFSFGGDEHIFAEVDDSMSLEAFFKSLFITNAVRGIRTVGSLDSLQWSEPVVAHRLTQALGL